VIAIVALSATPLVVPVMRRPDIQALTVAALAVIALSAAFHLTFVRTGRFDLGVAGTFGIGAVMAALLYRDAGWPLLLTLPAAAATTAVVGALLGLALRRAGLTGFAVATGLLGLALPAAFALTVEMTGAAPGILIVDGLRIGGLDLSGPVASHALVAALTLAAIGGVGILTAGTGPEPGDAPLAATMALAAALAGATGAVWAHVAGYMAPSDFGPGLSLLIAAGAALGGLGLLAGAVLGAALVVLVAEAVRLLVESQGLALSLTALAALVLTVAALPRGVLGGVSLRKRIARHIDELVAFGARDDRKPR
jgi:branched-chain amino acid transport system permease protein